MPCKPVALTARYVRFVRSALARFGGSPAGVDTRGRRIDTGNYGREDPFHTRTPYPTIVQMISIMSFGPSLVSLAGDRRPNADDHGAVVAEGV